MEKIAVCKFCGQIQAVELPIDATELEAEEIGTMSCSCSDAQIYQRKKQQAQKAKDEVEALFANDHPLHNVKKCDPEVVEMLKTAVDLLSESQIHKITLGICGGGTADIKCDAKGKITVSRTFSIKTKREDE